jgi:antitoxin MazE
MKARIQKWGNSLALRIPKSFATEAHLAEESVVDVTVVKGKLVVASVATPKITLEKLLAGINEKNLHGEVSTGPAVGAEEW